MKFLVPLSLKIWKVVKNIFYTNVLSTFINFSFLLFMSKFLIFLYQNFLYDATFMIKYTYLFYRKNILIYALKNAMWYCLALSSLTYLLSVYCYNPLKETSGWLLKQLEWTVKFCFMLDQSIIFIFTRYNLYFSLI